MTTCLFCLRSILSRLCGLQLLARFASVKSVLNDPHAVPIPETSLPGFGAGLRLMRRSW